MLVGWYACSMNAVQKLRQLAGEIEQAGESPSANAAWSLAGRLLERFPIDQPQAQRVCSERDYPGLDALLTQLENPGQAKEATGAGASGAEVEVSEKEMTAALRAFRKRLKLARLSDESKLGGRQMTSGRTSEIDAILPPTDYPRPVWTALVDAGKLKYTGQGFYALV